MAFFTTLEVAGLLVSSTLAYAAIIVIYRLTLHPLANYPGPFLARISGWPDALSAIKGARHVDFHQLHARYGDVVRFAPDSVSFVSPAALQDIYADRHANVIKCGWTEASVAINHTASTQTMSDRKAHARKRRLLSQAFSESALRSAETYVVSRIRAWCDFVVDGKPSAIEWSKPKDMGHWSTLLTLDVLGELCFGASFGSMEAGGSTIIRLLVAAGEAVQRVAYMPIRHLLFPILGRPEIASVVGGQMTQDRIAYRATMRELVDRRQALEKDSKKPARKDFFHYLLHAKDPETGACLTGSELAAEASLLVAAGMDTSSTTLSALVFYLCQNPRVMTKLTTQLRAAFNDVEEIVSGPKLSAESYLRACIDETLRMTPPVPGILTRKVLPGGTRVEGTEFPAGTVVGVSAYAMHHNEANYPHSFTYLPERWLEEDEDSKDAPFAITAESVARAKEAFCPFSIGSRGCVGKNMAYMELLIGAGRLLWLYDLRFAEGEKTGGGSASLGIGRERESEYQLKDIFIADREGPVVQFKTRQASAA